MYPVLFRFGNFEITSFGVMVALAALTGLWLFRRELTRSGLPPDAADVGAWGVVGGLAGAELLWGIEHAGEEPVLQLLFSPGGLSGDGGLIGGGGGGPAGGVKRPVPPLPRPSAGPPAPALRRLLAP